MTIRCKDCDKGHCDRWDHLVDRAMHEMLQNCQKWVEEQLQHRKAVTSQMTMGDEVPRCACGGMFQPNAAGNSGMVCDCCGATWDFGDKPGQGAGLPPDEEVGKTSTEVLLARRRRSASNTWTPSDDDVKVTVRV